MFEIGLFIDWLRTRRRERSFTSISSRFEKYSTGSDSSRLHLGGGDTLVAALRIPLKSKIRFSYLTYDYFNEIEHEYYSEKRWVKIGDLPHDKSEEHAPLLIMWTDDAYGYPELYQKLNPLLERLSNFSLQIHADGSYLRVIIKGPTAELDNIMDGWLKPQLETLHAQLMHAKTTAIHRKVLVDRSPIVSWIVLLASPFMVWELGNLFTPHVFLEKQSYSKLVLYLLLFGLLLSAIFFWRSRSEFLLFKAFGTVYGTITLGLAIYFMTMLVVLNSNVQCNVEIWQLLGARERRIERKGTSYIEASLSNERKEIIEIEISDSSKLETCRSLISKKQPVTTEVCRAYSKFTWANWVQIGEGSDSSPTICRVER